MCDRILSTAYNQDGDFATKGTSSLELIESRDREPKESHSYSCQYCVTR